MIANSITHVLQLVLQYIALIMALFLYRWIKDVLPLSRFTHTTFRRHVPKCRSISLVLNEWSLVYQWIRKIRERRGFTQEEFAEKMNVDPRTVQRWEHGTTRPQPHHYHLFLQIQREKYWGDDYLDLYLYPETYDASQCALNSEIPPEARVIPERRHNRIERLLISLAVIALLLATFVLVAMHFWFHII